MSADVQDPMTRWSTDFLHQEIYLAQLRVGRARGFTTEEEFKGIADELTRLERERDRRERVEGESAA